ncbi:MAG: hypothetical protein AAF694_11535 [Bacteroidota bacterium]
MKVLRFVLLTLFAFGAIASYGQEACRTTTSACKPSPVCKPSPECPPECCDTKGKGAETSVIQQISVPLINVQIAWNGLKKEQANIKQEGENQPDESTASVGGS